MANRVGGYGPFPVSAYGVPDRDNEVYVLNHEHVQGGLTLVEQFNSSNHPVPITEARYNHSAEMMSMQRGYNYKQRFDGV